MWVWVWVWVRPCVCVCVCMRLCVHVCVCACVCVCVCALPPTHLPLIPSSCCPHRPAMFNHSCEPNTVALFTGTQIHLRCIKEISEGEQVAVQLLPRATRCISLLRSGSGKLHRCSEHTREKTATVVQELPVYLWVFSLWNGASRGNSG